MSGWTRALTQGAAPASAALSSSPAATATAEATADTDFLGQPVSSALSSLFETRVQALLADESNLDAQQAVVDRLREGSEAETDHAAAAAAPSTSTASPASPAVAGAALTLASFAHALHRLNSFTLLGTQYGQLLDQLSWDLCDVLLPALQREWTRVTSRTEQSVISDAQGSDVASAEAFAAAAARPIASPVLTLLQHLLGEVFAHANPRESALTLLSFYERSVHVSAEEDQDEDEGNEQTAEDDADADADADTGAQGKDEAEVELVVSHKPSSTAAPTSTLVAFHRIALAFPLLEMLSSLLPRISAKAAAAGAGSTVASSSTGINSRQLELYQQLLGVMTHTMLHVSQQVSQRSEAVAGAADAVAQQRLAVDRAMWVDMHVRLLNKCIDIAQPVLVVLSNEALASAPDAAASSSSALRVSMLSFLFQQLFRFFSLYGLEAPELQSILDGNRAFAAKVAKTAAETASSSDTAAPSPATSVTPHLALLLSLLFRLCSCIDQCSVSPRELLSYFRHKRRLERAVEREELQQWEERGDGEWGADSDAEDDSDDDGNAHDDEYDSQDGFGENAALQAFDSEQARKRKPPSALQLLRRELAALPSYNIQGIGLYLATAYGYQYFWRIKPARTQAFTARNSAAAGASAAVAPVPDEPLAALLSSLPDIGSRLVVESQHLDARVLLDGVAPYLAGLLFHGLQSGESAFVSQGIAMATGLWALLPPGSISITEQQSGTTSEESGAEEADEAGLEGSGAWLLSESLLQCMYLCPPSWPSLRSSLLLLWKSLLSCLSVNTRFRMLQLSIGACSVASMQAVILQRIKEEIVSAWNEPPQPAQSSAETTSPAASEVERATFLTPDLLASLHSYVTQAEEDFLASLDLMLAALNLFRFLFLRERADAAAAAVATAASGGRLGLLLPAVKLVWLEKWREVVATAARETVALDADIATDRAAADADTPSAKATIAQTVMLRNQVMMAGDLAKLAIEHLEE